MTTAAVTRVAARTVSSRTIAAPLIVVAAGTAGTRRRPRGHVSVGSSTRARTSAEGHPESDVGGADADHPNGRPRFRGGTSRPRVARGRDPRAADRSRVVGNVPQMPVEVLEVPRAATPVGSPGSLRDPAARATEASLARAIPQLRDRGLRFVRLGEHQLTCTVRRHAGRYRRPAPRCCRSRPDPTLVRGVGSP
jgi:hypothetical protein